MKEGQKSERSRYVWAIYEKSLTTTVTDGSEGKGFPKADFISVEQGG